MKTKNKKKSVKSYICRICNGKGKIEKYFDAGDHFSAGPSPNSGWYELPCPECANKSKAL